MAATTTTSVSPMPAISQSLERGGERGGERGTERGGERGGERGAKRQRDDEHQEPGRYDCFVFSLNPSMRYRLHHLVSIIKVRKFFGIIFLLV